MEEKRNPLDIDCKFGKVSFELGVCLQRFKAESFDITGWKIGEVSYADENVTMLGFCNPEKGLQLNLVVFKFWEYGDVAIPMTFSKYRDKPHDFDAYSNTIRLAALTKAEIEKVDFSTLEDDGDLFKHMENYAEGSSP